MFHYLTSTLNNTHTTTAPCIVLHRTVFSLNAAEESLYAAEQKEKLKTEKQQLNENRTAVHTYSRGVILVCFYVTCTVGVLVMCTVCMVINFGLHADIYRGAAWTLMDMGE